MRNHFYYFAPEFADLEHYQPQLAVVSPWVSRPDGSYIQLEYRNGECIPYAVARYHLPDLNVYSCGCSEPNGYGKTQYFDHYCAPCYRWAWTRNPGEVAKA